MPDPIIIPTDDPYATTLAGHVHITPGGRVAVVSDPVGGVFIDADADRVMGLRWSSADGSPTGTTTLISETVRSAVFEIIYEPDGVDGYVLVRSFSPTMTTWVIRFEGSSFAPAVVSL